MFTILRGYLISGRVTVSARSVPLVLANPLSLSLGSKNKWKFKAGTSVLTLHYRDNTGSEDVVMQKVALHQIRVLHHPCSVSRVEAEGLGSAG